MKAVFQPAWALLRRYSLYAVLTVFACTGGYLSLLIQQGQSALTAHSGADLSFSVNQFTVELIRVGQTLGGRLADLSPPSDVDVRYDILVSRVELLRTGEEYREFLDPSNDEAKIFSEIHAGVVALEPLLSNQTPVALRQALSIVTALTPKALALAASANSARARRASARQLELLHLHWGFSAVSGGLLFLGLLQLFSLARQNRKLHDTHEKLRVQNSQFDAAVSHIPQGLALLDGSGRLLIRNEQLASVLGLPASELPIGSALDKPLREVIANPEEKLDAGKRQHPQVITSECELREGRTVLVSRRDMREGGSVLTVEDITFRVQAERERRELEAQLRQSQKMEAVGQLTGGIAHDFNNLLTVILGNAEVLVEDPADEQSVQMLASMILQAAERGADLTHKLLAFGRRQSLTPEKLDVARCVEGISPLLRRAVSENIEIRSQFGPTRAKALVDRALLESALLNLVVNARDAMGPCGILTISTGERLATKTRGGVQEGQPVLFISVADTGTGIPPEVLNRVFEPFFTTKEVGKGSGLGLSMVYGFAEQSGGFVDIESQVGTGTTVTIFLPLHVDEVSVEQEVRVSSTSELDAGQSGRVLVVEDDPQVLQFVSAQVRSLGYSVTSTRTAPEALSLLRSGAEFDVLFSDVVLPGGMNGVELAELVRKEHPSTRVLLTSGYAEEVFATSGRPAPDNLVLRKPYKKPELAQALRIALEGSAGTPDRDHRRLQYAPLQRAS